MNRVSVWQEFNACQFLVAFCLLIFSILYACRQEIFRHWPYWLVFLPLFIWKFVAIVGATIGILTYCCVRPRNRDRHSPIQCRALFLTLLESLLLLTFEVLTCYNLEKSPHSTERLTWIVCFLPLIILSILSVFTYVWLLRHGRSWEIQALLVVNILQFIFFALKLDNSIITWHYGAVFIPLWIVMSISIFFSLGRMIWTFVHYHRTESNQQRFCQILASPAVGHLCTLIFLLIFQILLVFYLERTFELSFLLVCLPLYIALLFLLYMSFNSRVPANHWWFGLRQDVCSWLLHICPVFETYANIEYHFPPASSPRLSTARRANHRHLFRQKSSASSKVDQCEHELLNTVIHLPLNISKLHEPD